MTPNLRLALIPLVLVVSCAALQAPGPQRSPARPRVWDVPPSTLVVPLRVSQGQVRQWAESAVPKTLEGSGSGQRTLTAWFMKHDWHYWWDYHLVRSPLALTYDGPRVRLAATLTGTLEARWDTLAGDISSDVEADAGVEATVALASDWRLAPTVQSFLEVRRADVPIGIAWDGNFFGETISIAAPVQEALKPSLVTLDRELRQWLQGLEVRPAAEAVWRDLEEPRSLGNGLWFALGPQDAAIGALSASADAVSVDLVLTARPSLTLGNRPNVDHRPLPPVAAPSGPSAFVVNLPVTVEWDQALKAALARLGPDRTVGLGLGGSLVVQGMEGSTDGDRALVKLWGKVSPPWPAPAVDAVLWLSAVPEWDPAARTLRLTHLALEVKTKDFLAASASWLVGGTWVASLEKTLVWDLGPQLDQWKAQAAQALGAQPLGPHLTLAATVDRFEVVDLTLAERGPEVLARVTGAASVHWTP